MYKVGMEAIYKVEFMTYSYNVGFIGVYNKDKTKLIKIPLKSTGDQGEPFLVKKSELDHYAEFGGGFRSIEFVGYMEV